MELSELQQINDRLDLQIRENIQINKELLCQFLKRKLSRTILWMKIRSAWIILFLLYVAYMAIRITPVRNDLMFWIGTTIILIIYGYIYFRSLRNLFLIWNIDSTESVLKLQKRIYKLKHANRDQKYDWSPVSILLFFLGAVLLEFIPLTWHIIPFFILPIIIWIAVNGFISNPVNKEINKLDKTLDDISELEK